MDDMLPRNSAMKGYFRLLFLAEEIRKSIVDYAPTLDDFDSFSEEIKLIHRGLFSIIMNIRAPITHFKALGLRTTEEAWRFPPRRCHTAMLEVGRLMRSVEPFINLRNGNYPLPDYRPVFDIGVTNALDTIQNIYDNHTPNQIPRPQARATVPGATDEQINSMPVHITTSQDAQRVCSICFSSFVPGEHAKILRCCHWFHKRCIDSWLKVSATCPMDRSIVFSN